MVNIKNCATFVSYGNVAMKVGIQPFCKVPHIERARNGRRTEDTTITNEYAKGIVVDLRRVGEMTVVCFHSQKIASCELIVGTPNTKSRMKLRAYSGAISLRSLVVWWSFKISSIRRVFLGFW